jgi:hypothetical protein
MCKCKWFTLDLHVVYMAIDIYMYNTGSKPCAQNQEPLCLGLWNCKVLKRKKNLPWGVHRMFLNASGMVKVWPFWYFHNSLLVELWN